jgi:hypothetical protein
MSEQMITKQPTSIDPALARAILFLALGLSLLVLDLTQASAIRLCVGLVWVSIALSATLLRLRER